MSKALHSMLENTKNDFPVSAPQHFDVNIIISKILRVPVWNHPNVSFRVWLFYWNPTPGASITTSTGETMALDADQVVLISPYTTFSTGSVAPFEHFYIHFSADAPFNRIKRGIFVFDAVVVRRVFDRLPGASGIAQMLLQRILLYEYLLRLPPDSFLAPGKELMDKRIMGAIDWMSSDLRITRGNAELCRRAGLSANGFHRLFLHETGNSPKRYLLNLRMEEAKRFLLHSDESIDEIAARTGYADRYHFSKAFTAYYGTPPAAFRKQMMA